MNDMNEIDETARVPRWANYCGDMTPRDWRNAKRILAVTLGFAVTLLATTYLIRREVVSTGPIGWAVAAAPSVVAIFVVFAYGRYIREADELQRAIHLTALAIGMGACFIATTAYMQFERLGAPVADFPENIMLVMAVAYSLGVVWGVRRYR